MSWGVEIWDQFDIVERHTLQGIDFTERYCRFVKDRCRIEMDYANQIRKLIKSYSPRRKDEIEYEFTWGKALLSMMNELNDIANQHEIIAENLTDNIAKVILELVQDLKAERKKYILEGRELQSRLHQSYKYLEQSKKTFKKSSEDADRAKAAFDKADQDMNVTKAEVEKCRQVSLGKNQITEQCKVEYASQLLKTNEHQNEHYTQLMPAVFQNLENMDTKRIDKFRNLIHTFAKSQRDIMVIIGKCLDGVDHAADTIDIKKDVSNVIIKHKTGFDPPNDFDFIDYTKKDTLSPASSCSNNSTGTSFKRDTVYSSSTPTKLKKTKRKRVLSFLHKSSKSDEIRNEYEYLPPLQQKRKLQERIDEVNEKINQEMSARDGMTKMRDVYANNPQMGDPAVLDNQLIENGKLIDKYRKDLQKYQLIYSNVDKPPLPTLPAERKHSDKKNNSSVKSSKCRTESQLSTSSHNSALHSDGFDPDGEFYNEYEDADELQPVIRSCRVLYPFEAMNEASISIQDGEILGVIEEDKGDGWTKVRRDEFDEGYVPTTYIQNHTPSQP